MRSYLIYKDKSARKFKKLINTGSGIFDKYRVYAVDFIKYSTTEFDEKLSTYEDVIDINSIQLENVFPTQFKWLVKDKAMRDARTYLDSLEDRIGEFENGKENNLKILVGVLFLRYVIMNKLVDIYISTAYTIVKEGGDISTLSLDSIGISKRILVYFTPMEDLCNKTIDEWLNISIDEAKAKRFFSSMKRIMTILD